MKMTKEESIRWVNHAIAFYHNLGKTQKELANHLGIKPSRLSELKNPQHSLTVSPTQMKSIVELCGAPKRDEGRFEYAEVYDSLALFFDQYLAVTLDRFHQNLFRYFSDQETLDELAKSTKANHDTKELTYKAIAQYVKSPEFGDLMEGESTSEHQYYELSQQYDLSIDDRQTIHKLRLLHSLLTALPSFQLGTVNTNQIKIRISNVPVVMTGKRIIAFLPETTCFDYPANQHVKNAFKHLIPNGYSPSVPKPEEWSTIRVEVYLSENMNYHVLIHMAESDLRPTDMSYQPTTVTEFGHYNYDSFVGKKDRIAIIKNINTLELFDQIEALLKWQGIEAGSLYELKQNIAKAGGHVAGALVLT